MSDHVTLTLPRRDMEILLQAAIIGWSAQSEPLFMLAVAPQSSAIRNALILYAAGGDEEGVCVIDRNDRMKLTRGAMQASRSVRLSISKLLAAVYPEAEDAQELLRELLEGRDA